MFATYALSVRILRRNHQLMKLIALGSVRRKGPKPPSDVAIAATAADAAGNRPIVAISGSGQKTRRTNAIFGPYTTEARGQGVNWPHFRCNQGMLFGFRFLYM